MPDGMSFDHWAARAAALKPQTLAWIDGRAVEAGDGRRFQRHSPIDGRIVADIARCGAAEIDQAVRAARASFESGVWSRLAPAERKKTMLRFADLMERDRELLALLETVEVGKPIGDTLQVDVPNATNCIRWYAEAADKIYDEIAPTGPKDLALIKRMPLGVIGAIVPWNYPQIIACWKLGPALVLGNSVVLKPAEQSSLASLHLGQLALEAGIPPGVLNVVPGLGEEAGAALSAHPDVDLIAFTGSTQVGRLVMAAAATSNLKRVALELGGKSPFVVMEDCADLEAAATAAAWAVYYNAGQTCHAGTRLLVQPKVKEPLFECLAKAAAGIRLGHPLDPATQIGALVEPAAKDRVLRYIRIGQEEGGSLRLGGQAAEVVPGGCFVQPTLIADVSNRARVAQEEIFGPVIVAIDVQDEAEAIHTANDTIYGLAAAVWTRDINRAHRMSEAIRAGTVWINAFDRSGMITPFGGFKQSGFGRDRSLHALDKYADLKTVWTHYA